MAAAANGDEGLVLASEIHRGDDIGDQPWRIVFEDRLASIEGLHRLSLSVDKQYAAKNLVLRAVDFELRLPAGDVFVSETPEGVTAIVLFGDGTMVFEPLPKEERGQLKLFSGVEALETLPQVLLLHPHSVPSERDAVAVRKHQEKRERIGARDQLNVGQRIGAGNLEDRLSRHGLNSGHSPRGPLESATSSHHTALQDLGRHRRAPFDGRDKGQAPATIGAAASCHESEKHGEQPAHESSTNPGLLLVITQRPCGPP